MQNRTTVIIVTITITTLPSSLARSDEPTDMENSVFEEWLADYEAELREGVQKRFGIADGIGDKDRLSDESLQDKDQGT